MADITILTRNNPTINGFEAHATLESNLYASAEVTTYPIESGARAADHIIIQPIEYSVLMAFSNNPLKPQVTDFIGGVLSNAIGLELFAGLSAGLLSGSDNTIGSAVLQSLVALMVDRVPFVVDGGDVVLQNMVITGIERTRTAENENGLEVMVTMQEYPLLGAPLGQAAAPQQEELNPNDPAYSGAAALVQKGQKSLQAIGEKINSTVAELF